MRNRSKTASCSIEHDAATKTPPKRSEKEPFLAQATLLNLWLIATFVNSTSSGTNLLVLYPLRKRNKPLSILFGRQRWGKTPYPPMTMTVTTTIITQAMSMTTTTPKKWKAAETMPNCAQMFWNAAQTIQNHSQNNLFAVLTPPGRRGGETQIPP